MATDNDRYDDDFEEEYEDTDEQPEGDYVELYSKWSIWGFSIFFSSFLGAALLIRNLWVSGFKRVAFGIGAFALIYSCVSYAAIISIPTKDIIIINLLVILANIIGGYMYAVFFYKRYFPADDYYPKSIWGALGIAILIYMALAVIMKQIDPEAMKQLTDQ